MKTLSRILSLVLALMLLAGCAEHPVETVPTTEDTLPPATTLEPTQETTVETTQETTVETQPQLQPLVMALPKKSHTVTADETLLFQGTADPGCPVEINGSPVLPGEDGFFAYEVPLELGENTVTVTYQGQTLEYTAQRWYTTAWHSHQEDSTCHSGASVYAEIYAREGSRVVVRFNGVKKELNASSTQLTSGAPEGFDYYTCRFDSTSNNWEDVDLGPITFTVTCDDVKEVITTGNITCLEMVPVTYPDSSVTPDAEGYRNVGSGYIVEIVEDNAETFDGTTVDDRSMPTMNYLPKGTVDYGSQGTYYNQRVDRYYHLLRCGVRVYRRNENKPMGMVQVVDCYYGRLPDHNEIAVADFYQEDHFTYLTLDCLWKAPFFFDEELQDYADPATRDYAMEVYDASYIDITFCYATVFSGEGLLQIPEDHPLFSRAEVIRNEADYTLRLHLKEPGGFYGWDASYNDQGQLVFRFLNPVTVTRADNAYGADLTGVRIMIDVGHGGMDTGAGYSAGNGKYYIESERNQYLADLVKAELESIGATVIMNRYSNEETVTRKERTSFLLQQAPDFCICIHHNANTDREKIGFESWYFTNFSLEAAIHQQKANAEAGVYTRSNMAWYYYFVCRQTPCPIVLAENGYMSNYRDMNKIADPEAMQTKAVAITKGIANYYLEESGFPVSYSADQSE